MSNRTEAATAAVNRILAHLGSNLRHYMPVHRDAAVAEMAAVLGEEREWSAGVADRWAHRDTGRVIAALIREGR